MAMKRMGGGGGDGVRTNKTPPCKHCVTTAPTTTAYHKLAFN